MNLLWKLGFRNIRRNWSRSALTIIAVVLCSGGITLYQVLLSGVMDNLVKNIIEENGHVELLHSKRAKKPRLGASSYMPDADNWIKKIEKLPNVKAATARVNVGAFIDNDDKQSIAMGKGIDPEKEKKAGVWNIHKKFFKGRMLLTNPPKVEVKGKGRKARIRRKCSRNEIAIGKELAKRLDAKVGTILAMMGSTRHDSPAGLCARVSGIFDMGNALHNKQFFISLKAARYFVDLEQEATSVLVFASHSRYSKSIAKGIKKLKPPKTIHVRTWLQGPLASYMIPAVNAIIFFLGGFVVFIGGIGLLNTMLMSLLERKSEVGIMMAMGMRPMRVAAVFLIEGVVFGIVGAVLGVGLACLGSIPLITKGIDMGTEATAKMPIAMESVMKGALSAEAIITGLVVGILCTVFGSLWPAWKASRMEPIDALRE